MSQLEKLKKLLEFLPLLLDNGQTLDTSILSELPEVKDYIISQNSLTTDQLQTISCLIQEKKSVIVEFLQLDRMKTSNDKFNLCSHSFQTIRSLLISVLELTLNGKVSSTFWNCLKAEQSQKLLLPIETDSVALPLNCSNGFFNTTKSNSWFSIKRWTPQVTSNWQKSSFLSSTFSIAENKVKESTKRELVRRPNQKRKKAPANCTRKFRLYLNKNQQSTLNKWFGSVRKTYNWALENIENRHVPINRYWLRNRYVNACNIPTKFGFLKDVPKHVREGAIDDLVDAFVINFRKGDKFQVKYRSKKVEQAIVLPKDAIKSFKNYQLTFYPTMFPGSVKLFSRVPLTFNYDCRIIKDRLGRYYLAVPIHKPTVSACDNKTGSIVAVDPGVRTFATTFGVKQSETEILKFGDKDITRIYRLCKHLDKLVSKQKTLKDKSKKKSHKKAEHRQRFKIKNLVRDVHWKTASYLCKEYDHVIYPPFKISQMVLKGKRNITSKTVRGMYTWSYYTFRQRLEYKASQLGSQVHVLGEEYTTKVCSNCGYMNPNVGGSKKIVCPCCNIKVDRDVSGARNIFIKNTKLLRET